MLRLIIRFFKSPLNLVVLAVVALFCVCSWIANGLDSSVNNGLDLTEDRIVHFNHESYFMSVQKGWPMTNPYDISIAEAPRQIQSTFRSIRNPQDQIAFLQEATKAVFTRNPYSRIFSAYIDKLYSPNPTFWKVWGKRAIILSKLPANKYPCGSQVSFKHFIKTLIQDLWKRDFHFIPMDAMCKFCDVDYDVIGKVENSIEDIEFLSGKINISSSFLHEKGYRESSAKDAILDSTNDALSSWRDAIAKCISTYDSGRIIWRKLQIRGLIYAGIDFPFNKETMESVTLDEFRGKCFQAAQNSTDTAKLKRQKLVAFQQAYSTLPQSDITRLQQIYKRDFTLLGYDNIRPDASISKIGWNSSDSLDWLQSWTLK